MIAGACGENDVHKLNKQHLQALNSEIAKIANIRLLGEEDKPSSSPFAAARVSE